MAIDREVSLRRAEKLLRQGRLDGAIEEYARLLEDQPNDWNTRNVLGDLYVRANQIEQAAAQFAKIADHFAEEGFLPRAIALYKKVVKIRPDDEHALLQTAEICAKQGLLVEAKTSFAAVAELRRRSGDKAGSNLILIQIATLDPADMGARMAAARGAAEMGDAAGAAERYKQLATELFQRDRPSEAIDALAEAVHLDGADEVARDSLVAAYLERGEIEEARRYAASGAHFRAIAEELSARGQEHEALEALFEAVQRDPADGATRARLVRSLIEGGELERATACLLPEMLGEDADLHLLAAEVHLRVGRREAARDLLRAALEREPARREQIVHLGCTLSELDRDLAFECIDVATEAATAAGDWGAAAAGLRDFLGRAPSHIPALIKLVDVCVDGDLDDVLLVAQADLAEAYLAAGRAFEARVIAEDLLSRTSGDKANVDRFRRALVMLGEVDPDALIADRLTPDTSFSMEDLNAVPGQTPPPETDAGPAKVLPFSRTAETPEPMPVVSPPVTLRTGTVSPASPLAAEPVPDVVEPGIAPEPARREVPAPAGGGKARPAERVPTAMAGEKPRSDIYDLSSADLNIDEILGGDTLPRAAQKVQPTPVAQTPQAPARPSESDEIDLSSVLTDLKPGQPPVQPAPRKGKTPAPAAGGDLDEVFEEMRKEVVREQATSAAAQHYKVALTYHDMGMTAECIKALESAARSPRYRFQAASLLGRIHRHEGRTHEAIDWFERAAEAPASNVEAGRALLYELGQALEEEGEAVRALAVYLELQADAGAYRDVPARIKRLSR